MSSGTGKQRGCAPRLAAMDSLISGLVALTLLALALRLWRRDLTVPFSYWGDTLYFAALVKGLLLNGWPLHIPQLAAPFGFDAVAFPSISSTDWLLMRVIALFVDSSGAVLNLFWLLSVMLTACSCTLALRLLGSNRLLAVAAGVLFAVLPFALMRSTAHISLVYYTVPLLSALCVYLIRGDPSSTNAKLLFWSGLAAAVAQGFNYVYFSFFALGLIALSGLIGFFLQRQRKIIAEMAVICAILGSASALNLAPVFYNWRTEGKPSGMDYKRPAEAEVYGLKLRHLLLPHQDNQVPPLRAWVQLDRAAAFPSENENGTARLGLFGAVGFLIGLCLLVRAALDRVRTNDDDRALAAAVLLLVTLLVTTIGGFGAIFSVLITPDIRAYNRFSVFLAFFAFAVLVLFVSKLLQRHKFGWGSRTITALTSGLILFSAYDQLLEARRLASRHSDDRQAAVAEQQAVRILEAAFPDSASVFQLPVTAFPLDGGREKMGIYDHARPFQWSSRLKWSWPSLSNRHQAWVAELVRGPIEEMAEALVLAGFDAIWLDRLGYADGGKAIIGSLQTVGVASIGASAASRFALLDLRPVRDAMKVRLGIEKFRAAADQALPAVSVQYDGGFYAAEKRPDGLNFRWMQCNARMTLRNHTEAVQEVSIDAILQTAVSATVVLSVGKSPEIPLVAGPNGIPMHATLSIPSQTSLELHWRSSHSPLNLPTDTRSLCTALISFGVSSLPLLKSNGPVLR